MKIVSVIIAIVLGLIIYIFTLLIRNTTLPHLPITETPKVFGIRFSDVSFPSTDQLQVKGWWVLQDPRFPTIILCHGFGTNRADLLDFVNILYQGGWNLLLFDFRGHGESPEKVTSFGYLEQQDLAGAIQYLDSLRDLQNHDYGVFGVSMGGAVAILEAAKNPKIRAVAVDSCYATLSSVMARYMKLLYHLPEWPLGAIAAYAWQVRFGTSIKDVSPLERIADIAPRPVLIFHGENDDRVPVSDARQLHERARNPKEIWITPKARHLESYSVSPEKYHERLLLFFQRGLPLHEDSTAD